MLTMFDSISISQLPGGTGYCYAGYVNGSWPTYNSVVADFPGHNVLSIAVNAGANADCLDVENFDATPGQAAGWYARQLARGVQRPCIYASAGVVSTILSLLAAAGVTRSAVRIWSAHYTTQHICGPNVCGYPAADGTQWTSRAMGRNLDQSMLVNDFFGTVPPPAPPNSTVTYLTVAEMSTIMALLPVLQNGMSDAHLPHWYVHRVQSICNGVFGAKLTVDGAYGSATETAVKAVQKQFSLTQDGVCGPATWTVLVAG
jgi:peptidoglycan hydrolase-like protein with peptidoglycan-binding domain